MGTLLTKRIAAGLNLALKFNIHLVHRAITLILPAKNPLARFLEHYCGDNITIVSQSDRAALFDHLHCINCGTCDLHCPLLTSNADPAFPGPSALVAAASRSFPDLPYALDAAHRCMLCGQCELACPQKIPISEIARHIRRTAYTLNPGTHPPRIKRVVDALATTKNIFAARPEPLQQPQSKVLFFRGCVLRYKLPEESVRLRAALSRSGVQVDFFDEVCCGQVQRELGQDEADRFMQENLDRIRSLGATKVIVACPACYLAWKAAVVRAPSLTVDFALNLLAPIDAQNLDLSGIAVFPGCRLARGAIGFSWRTALTQVGIQSAIELWQPDESPCCGAAGLVAMNAPGVGAKLATSILESARIRGVKKLLVLCPTSYYQLLKVREEPHPVLVTITELLASVNLTESAT